MEEYSVIGKRLPRVDAVEKVTGKAVFTGDIKFQNILYGKILRSPYAHATILNIDSTKAKRLPGVKAVITAADTPNIRYGTYLKDRTIFAFKKVRFIGEPVAAVAAVDEDIAKEALDLIKVEYEELPAVIDPEEAMRPEAPIIHEDLASYIALYAPVKYGNVCCYIELSQGDAEKGFKRSDHIFEDVFKVPSVHQCHMEPHVSIAEFDAAGKVTIRTSAQMPFVVRGQIAEALNMPMTKIRVMTSAIGGGFGGKTNTCIEPFAVLLAKETNKPVKVELTMEEEFSAGTPRHPAKIELKTGVSKDGKIVARQAKLIYDCGAYSHEGPGVLAYGAMLGTGPYKIPNISIKGYLVYTNKITFGAFRGYGLPQAYFAEEVQMDIIAEKLGIDPLEIRLLNAAEDGDLLPTGQKWRNATLKKTLQLAADHINWKDRKKRKEPNRGIGVACIGQMAGLFSSCSFIKVNEDGTVAVLAGSVDIGTGTNTALSQIVAEELGVRIEDVTLITGDTDTTPFDWGTVASRVTYNMGNAVKMAATDAKRQLLQRGAAYFEEDVNNLEIKERKVFVKDNPSKSITIMELSMAAHWFGGGPILGKGVFFSIGDSYDIKSMKGFPWPPVPAFIFATQIIEVQTDPESGVTNVLRVISCHDAGKVINLNGLEGQVEGGVSQGLGYGLSEEIRFDRGKVLTTSFRDYRLLTAPDMPEINTLIIEEPEETGPFGAKGIGEAPLIPSAPALANAVYDAVGVRIKELPLTPEKVLQELKQKQRVFST